MDKDGGLAERERQDAEREADHQERRTRLAGEMVSDEETTEAPAPPSNPKPKSRARAKSKSK